ncbi:DUF3616 domain-containing protein [Sphingomonas sp. MMS24-JH45]
MTRALALTLAGAAMLVAAPALAFATGDPVPITVGKGVVGKKGAPAEDLSGMACQPPGPAGERVCLLIDKLRSAQWVTLRRDAIEAGATVALDDVVDVVGPVATKTACRAVSRSPASRFDGEAVAYAAPYWYVAGSHGCSRKKRLFSPMAFRLYRFSAGATVAEAATTRIRDVLLAAAGPGAFAEKALDANGVTVEGFAVIGAKAYVGLRAPVVTGGTYLLEMDLAALFAPGTTPIATPGRVVPIALGADMGVRDLAPLPDGRLLVLAGPAQVQPGAFSLSIVDPASGDVTPVPAGPRPPAKTCPGGRTDRAIGRRGVAIAIVMFDGVAGRTRRSVAVEVSSPPSRALRGLKVRDR